MAITPLASQPNCNLSFFSHYGGLPVLRLAVEAVEALVLVVLDVHGLLDNPGHGVLVLGQHSDLELGRGSVVHVHLVVVDEGVVLLLDVRVMVFNSSRENISRRFSVVTAVVS